MKKFPSPFIPHANIPGLTPSFNPKKITEECQNPKPKKKLPVGPFIDHVTDTYTGGVPLEEHLKRQAHIKMSLRTVRNLKFSRVTMMILRILLILACIGLMVLMISMKGLEKVSSWILRVPPGVTIVHALYSTYHYARSARERTPYSSASYALFACATDCCLIPFFVLTCIYSWRAHGQILAGSTDNVWSSIIGPAEWIEKLVFISFVLGAVGGGLLVFCVLLSMFIAVTYRRIAKMPPDMNPLDTTTYTSLIAKADAKRWSQSTTNTTERQSMQSQRQIPFLQTRTTNGTLEWEYSPVKNNGEGEDDSALPSPEKSAEWEKNSGIVTVESRSHRPISTQFAGSVNTARPGGFSRPRRDSTGTMTSSATATTNYTRRERARERERLLADLPALPSSRPQHTRNNSSTGISSSNSTNANAWWSEHRRQRQEQLQQKRNTVAFGVPTVTPPKRYFKPERATMDMSVAPPPLFSAYSATPLEKEAASGSQSTGLLNTSNEKATAASENGQIATRMPITRVRGYGGYAIDKENDFATALDMPTLPRTNTAPNTPPRGSSIKGSPSPKKKYGNINTNSPTAIRVGFKDVGATGTSGGGERVQGGRSTSNSTPMAENLRYRNISGSGVV